MHTMNMDNEIVQIKYLMTADQDVSWGLTINTVGFQNISKSSQYPPQNHPSQYLFDIEKGRILHEYYLLYIIRGRGFFISKEHKRVEIKEGQMFLLFPGEWHNYYPDRKTGWEEYWIGFNGINIDNYIENNFFKKKQPIYYVGIQEDIVKLYKQAMQIAKKQDSGYQQMLAGIVNLLLGYAYSYNKQSSFEDLRVINQINKAKILMAENLNKEISPKEIANEVNMSYSWFRHIFKQYTGFAPIQYMQELKINKSKELLSNSTMMIKEIAYEIGFNNIEYFYTLFKKKTGYTPDKYRELSLRGNAI